MIDRKIIFFGTEDFSLTSLKQLVENGFQISAVVTKPDQPKGRGHKLTAPAVKTYALEHSIPVWQPQKLKEISAQIEQLAPVAGVLVSYGKIIPQTTIDLFTPGIINLHPSLLPKYRGPTPIESAIINGDAQTGVSIMQLSKAMDAGPVYDQTLIDLDGSETQTSLYQTLGQLGAKRLVEILPNILSGELQPQPQDDAKATYCQLLSKADSRLDPTKLTARQAEQKVRAHLEFPKTKYQIGENIVTVTESHVAEQVNSPLDIACQTGYLAIDQLVAPSGKTMSAEDFRRGYCAWAGSLPTIESRLLPISALSSWSTMATTSR